MLTERDYERSRARLAKQWKFEPSPADIAWAAMNDAVMRTRDLNSLSNIFFAKALFLHAEGRDCSYARRKSLEFELRHMQQQGFVKKVRIIATGCCEACMWQHDRVLTIRKALKTMPIPCNDCTVKVYGREAEYSYCRCASIAELD